MWRASLIADGPSGVDLTTAGGVVLAAITALGTVVKLFLTQLDKRDTQVERMSEEFRVALKELSAQYGAELKDMRAENRRINDLLFEANKEQVEVMSEMKAELRASTGTMVEMKLAIQTLSGRVDTIDARKTAVRTPDVRK